MHFIFFISLTPLQFLLILLGTASSIGNAAALTACSWADPTSAIKYTSTLCVSTSLYSTGSDYAYTSCGSTYTDHSTFVSTACQPGK